ncbi:unnamed protein product [Alopecurus aequalis]
MFRQVVASLLSWRSSPRATPRMVPARSLHSLRAIPVDDALLSAYVFAAALSAGGGLGLAVRYFNKGTCLDELARKEFNKDMFKEPDMETRFERWIVKNNRTYRDEDEKAMRFQLFTATVEFIESHPPSVQEGCFREISCFADYTEQESRCLLANPDGLAMPDEYYEMIMSDLAKQQKAGPLFVKLVA